MKKLFLLAFAATVSTALFAQIIPATKEERKDLRTDVKDLKKDRHELRKDIKKGDRDAAKPERKDIKADRKDIRQDAKQMGIKHPIKHIRRHPRHD